MHYAISRFFPINLELVILAFGAVVSFFPFVASKLN